MSNDPLNLDESGEWAGVWWLPDAPSEKVRVSSGTTRKTVSRCR